MTEKGAASPTARPALISAFNVTTLPPDLHAWRAGNTGIEGFTQFRSQKPGPHVVVLALMHGNEISGAIVLDRLLRQGIAPRCGTLTLGFVNLAAFDRFEPDFPTASRYVDEDLNRVWDAAILAGQGHSLERDRARQVFPLLATADIVLDLHSFLWPSDPLTLCGTSPRGRDLALRLPGPELVVADHGHAGGKRLIDHPRFTAPGSTAAAVLLEAGQHWQADAVTMAERMVRGLLAQTGMIDADVPPMPPAARRFAEVTHAISPATTQFAFVAPYRGGEVIARRNTLIAIDGTAEIRTPYDNCLLVMPSLRASRGHIAVRLAQLETA